MISLEKPYEGVFTLKEKFLGCSMLLTYGDIFLIILYNFWSLGVTRFVRQSFKLKVRIN